MLVWKLFLIILFATEHCLSVTLPKTKDEKDVEISGNKTVEIDLIKEKSINPVVTRESMDDYERISSYVIFYLSRMILNTWSFNNTNSKT